MCVNCVLTSPRIVQVDPDDEPLSEVVLSHKLHLPATSYMRPMFIPLKLSCGGTQFCFAIWMIALPIKTLGRSR
jgi:hypothetical protein